MLRQGVTLNNTKNVAMKNREVSSFYLLLLTVFLLINKENYAQSPDRTVLIEEFTGEWCGWCPLGMMELESLINQYGDTLIVIAVHTDDPMESPSASGMIAAWMSSAPSAIINRDFDTILDSQIFGTDKWDEVIARQIKTPAPCNVQLSYSYNETSREIDAVVTATFITDYIGDGRLNLFIFEDSVIGVSQSNYLSGESDFINTPFYSLPDHIDSFCHQHVLREMVGESYGIDSIIPDTVYSGQQFQHNFHYTIPDEYNIENLHIIGVVQQYKGLKKYRKILNSTHSKFNVQGTGIEGYSSNSGVIISPNPAVDFVQIKTGNKEAVQKVVAYSIDGSRYYTLSVGENEQQVNIQSLPNGCYIICVQCVNNSYQGKLIITK